MFNSIRNTAAFLMANILIAFGIVRKAVRKAILGNYILSIYFHDPDEKCFRSCIEWLGKRGFCFISPNELKLIAAGQKSFPAASVLITVDDGWKNNRQNIVEIAKKMKIPVTIFVSTEPVEKGGPFWWSYFNDNQKSKKAVELLKQVENSERIKVVNEARSRLNLRREALTIEDVKEISANPYISIGSHTVTHPILTKCSEERLKFELMESKSRIESWVGKKIDSFSFPNGSYTKREINALQNAGYKIAFTTRTRYLTRENIADLYTLPRFQILEKASFAENICRMTGVWFNLFTKHN